MNSSSSLMTTILGSSRRLKDGSALLSEYPQPKIIVSCGTCGMTVRYDKRSMLATAGDRKLTELLDEIVMRRGCQKTANLSANIHERCKARYANVVAPSNTEIP
jgi:Fe-S oxidoreductase